MGEALQHKPHLVLPVHCILQLRQVVYMVGGPRPPPINLPKTWIAASQNSLHSFWEAAVQVFGRLIGGGLEGHPPYILLYHA